jgi:PhnB protein
MTKPIPEGYEGATPYLIVHDAPGAIQFYEKAFGATEVMRFADPSGKIGHAEVKIGQALVMLADEYPDMDIRGPRTYGGSPVKIALFVPDVDAFVKRAIDAGAKVVRPVQDQFYGDRSGQLEDPYGHVWNISTHKEDVAPEEMHKRFAAMMKEQGAK